MSTPNVNFFIHYVPYHLGKSLKDVSVSKYERERGFYGCRGSYNQVEYVHKGSKEKLDYVEYSGNNEKSSGVFTEKGLLSDSEKLELKHRLAKTQSPIWHGLVSFEEIFGKTKCSDYETAYELMRTELPKFLRNAGLEPNNIEWFAGLHENTDHRHIHFSFFEKKPTKYRKGHKTLQFSNGKIPLFAIEKAKIDIEMKLTNWNRKFVEVRKNIRDEIKDYFNQGNYTQEINKAMKELKVMLPIRGRLQYGSKELENLRPHIDYIVDMHIQNNPYLYDEFNKFIDHANRKDLLIIGMCRKSKINPEKYLLKDKYKYDLYRRLGDQVLTSIKYLEEKQRLLDKNTKNYFIKKRIEKAKRKAEAEERRILARTIESEAINCFREYFEKLEEFEYENLKEQGMID